MSRRGKWLLVMLLILMGGSTLYARHYRGMTLGLFNHMRHATWGESVNLMRCIDYWMGAMELLHYDPEQDAFLIPPVVDQSAQSCSAAFHRGDFATAQRCVEQEIADHGPSQDRLFWLGMSALRQAEAINCLDHLTAEDHTAHVSDMAAYCTLPLVRTHQRKDSSQRAFDTFLRLLNEYDSEDRLYRWLLAWSAMTLDTYPDAVPPEYRLPEGFLERFYGAGREAVAQRHKELRFVDRAAELGVATVDTGRGVAVEDFDRDGDLDLVTGGNFETLHYYQSTRDEAGEHTFVDRTTAVGLAGVKQPTVITAADYDNDGWVDLFVGRPFDCYRLFRNDRGHFVDTTEESGLLEVRASADTRTVTWVSAWGDYDNDGDLDLFLAQWGFRLPVRRGLMSLPRMDSLLLENDAGRFKDVTRELGLADLLLDQHFIGASFGDYDNDGDADLFLSSPLRRTSYLLDNVGHGFERSDRFQRGEGGFVAAFVDVDHDSRLDIFQGGFSDARTSTEMTVFGEHLDRYRTGHSTLLMQRSDGFEERNDFFDTRMPMGTMGASFGDINNDGCVDFYLGTGNPESWFILPNQMLVGRRDGRSCTGALENISMLEGFGTIQKGHGIVFFDFDDDGDQDVYSALGGMWPADAWPNQLFVNESALDRAWVKIRLRGRQTNHYGVGARIRVLAETEDGHSIERYYHMNNKTGFGSAPYLAHIGLLDAIRINTVEVEWPVSRCSVRYPATIRRLNVLDERMCDSISAAGDDIGEVS